MASETRRLRVVIESVALVSMAGEVLTLAVSEAMLPVARGGLKEIEAIAARVSGAAVRVVLDSGGGVKSAGGPARDGSVGASSGGGAAVDMRQHPLVKQAEELFGARVVKVQQAAEGRAGGG